MEHYIRNGRTYVFNPTTLDRADPRHKALTGQVVRIKNSLGYAHHWNIESLDGKELGFVMGLSLVPIPRNYPFDPDTGLPRNLA